MWAEISASVYIYVCAQLPSCLGMQLNHRLRSLYVLLLCLYVLYTTSVTERFQPHGASTCSRWRPDQLRIHGCRLCTSGARKIRDLDKSITSFYPGRLTAAPTQLELCSLCFSRDLTAGDGRYTDQSQAIRT